MSVAINIPRTVSAEPARAEAQRQEWQRSVAVASANPLMKVALSAGPDDTPTAGDRVFTLRVVNRLGERCLGVYPALVVVGTADDGGPDGVQTGTWDKGVVIAELATDQAWLIYTASDGEAKLILNMAPAEVRYVRASVMFPVASLEATSPAVLTPGEWDFSTADNSDHAMLTWD